MTERIFRLKIQNSIKEKTFKKKKVDEKDHSYFTIKLQQTKFYLFNKEAEKMQRLLRY